MLRLLASEAANTKEGIQCCVGRVIYTLQHIVEVKAYQIKNPGLQKGTKVTNFFQATITKLILILISSQIAF